jgi:hypothetical protein
MRSRPFTQLALVGSLATLGCASSYADGTGVEEPIVVANATFNEGALPDDGGAPLPATGSVNGDAIAGGPEKSLSGRATGRAYGIGVRMKNAGSGFWVVPVGLPDLINVGDLEWALKFRFTRQAPLGEQFLLVAQSDGSGRFGTPSELKFTVKSLLPEGKKVISLIWHNHADLDLQVQGPSGKLTSSKRPNTEVVPDDNKIPAGGLAGNGVLNRDSNARCSFDGIMQEDVVFAADPTPGDYQVWVSEFDNCGEQSTTFELVLHEDGVETFRTAGRLLDLNADFGTGGGLFMNTFSF